MDCVKAMHNTSGIGKCFWAEALVCFTYAKNRIFHKFKNKTPYELYFGRKPTVSNLKVFGCHVYVGTPKQLRNKLDLRAKRGTMLGYACSTRGYCIWLPDEKKLIEPCATYDDPDESGKVVVGDSSRVNAAVENASNLKLGSSIPFYIEAILRHTEKYCKDNDILYDKSLFDFNSTVDHNANRPEASNIEVLIARHFKDAKNSPQSDKRHDAMKEEINVMKKRCMGISSCPSRV
ncbi:uncharacterized protein TNCV_4035011 [Trichonephila clavipes]|nr:uncharacterized protein TNCV_4035011 [Trichonephila clavipes]